MKNEKSELATFLQELTGFALVAEETLKTIEENMESNKGMFKVFADKMLTIRGSALQLKLDAIVEVSKLGEEIAVKGMKAASRPQIRKCIGSLWDALTTVQFILKNPALETQEEHAILINRLQSTLKAFGGPRATVDSDELAKLLQKHRST